MDMLELIKSLQDNDGFTVKNGKIIRYKSGWQVGIIGIECTRPDNVLRAMEKPGNYGVWFSNGIYYLDKCKRVNTKKEALEIGRKYHQQSVYNWKNGKLAWC